MSRSKYSWKEITEMPIRPHENILVIPITPFACVQKTDVMYQLTNTKAMCFNYVNTHKANEEQSLE